MGLVFFRCKKPSDMNDESARQICISLQMCSLTCCAGVKGEYIIGSFKDDEDEHETIGKLLSKCKLKIETLTEDEFDKMFVEKAIPLDSAMNEVDLPEEIKP